MSFTNRPTRSRLPAEQPPADWPWTIPLTQGFVSLVDESDYHDLIQFKWSVSRSPTNFYAVRKIPIRNAGKYCQGTVRMHRAILGYSGPKVVDHINGDGLDNRRCNLRTATRAQNSHNYHMTNGVSRFKGVWWKARTQAWIAAISKTESGKARKIYIGSFESEEDAAVAYDRKAVELFGDFACLNLPDQDDGRVLVRTTKGFRKGKNPRAKLTPGLAMEIRRRALAGETGKMLAVEFGISETSVSVIKNGHSWKWLEDDGEHKGIAS